MEKEQSRKVKTFRETKHLNSHFNRQQEMPFVSISPSIAIVFSCLLVVQHELSCLCFVIMFFSAQKTPMTVRVCYIWSFVFRRNVFLLQIICVTNFEGDERQRIKNMISVLGAQYTGYMTQANSVLVAKK